ncbi:39S ribosomal protein L33, mitochondrial [Echinococcus granulosus]|uniref:Ribosomal protein mitochondrial n=3 Tax=Echinococcus TaxID=6209 RepID=A0A068WHH3_ECHGR|nr:39S ribosomal protein L33, mitochondrial [Echinococcus granulosus]CDS19192.1 ribosomal protein mitochondrial [Echinococcus granulosus]CDS37244.1 mitochondrial ribosomal protein [Echinococcus multilocularis]
MSTQTTQGFVKTVMVMMESVVTGHRMVGFRPRQMTTKKEVIAFDPLVQRHVLYREIKKIRSLRKAGTRD